MSGDLSNLPLTGGNPSKGTDLAPSLIFAAAYAVLAVPVAVRLAKRASRHTILIRPLIFLVLQTVGFALRAAIAKGNEKTGLFIADQICSLAGFILICEPIVAMFQQLASLHVDSLSAGRAHLLRRVSRLARVVLLVALILGIVAASDIAGTVTQDKINTVKALRLANASLAMACVAIALAGTASLFFGKFASAKQFGTVAFSAVFVLVIAAYKIASTAHEADPYATGTKVAFYLLLALPQWLAALPYAVLNIKLLFFPPSYDESQRQEPGSTRGSSKEMTDLEGGAARPQGALSSYPPRR